MITSKKMNSFNQKRFMGKSEDVKPMDVGANSLFLELDTGKEYYFDGILWREKGSGEPVSPQGNIAITANGEYNVTQYQTANVNVPLNAQGNIEITENGENINVAPYATATVNVAGGGGLKTANITFVPTFPNSEIFASVYLGPLTLNYEYEVEGEPETDSFTGERTYNNQTANPVVTIPILDSATMVVGDIRFYDEDEMGPSDYFTIASSTITVSGNGELDGTALVVTGDCTVTCTLRAK